jgi:DNA-binding FadR family transcriptional regulator
MAGLGVLSGDPLVRPVQGKRMAGLGVLSGDPLLRPVRGRNPFEEALERIVQAIKLGMIAPGGRLPPERELSEHLGVSRVTLRAAIRALQQTGYVESRRGRAGGSFVVWQPQPPIDDVRTLAVGMGERLEDVLRFRLVLESGATALAAGQPLNADQRALLVRRLAEASAAPLAGYRAADARLHLAIAELAGSPSLAAAVADVQLELSDLIGAIPLLKAAVEHSQEQHERIVTAVLAGAADEARDAMVDHVTATSTLLTGFLG